MSGSSLADFLWGNQSNSGFTGYYGQLSSDAAALINPSTGKARVPTLADVDTATQATDKLTLLKQMADVVNVQADAAMNTGRADMVASMTQSGKDMLSKLSQVAAEVDMKAQGGAVGDALTSLRNAMDKISLIASRAPTDTASQVSSDLALMDNQAGALAKAAGTNWVRSGSVFRPDASKVLDIRV